MTPWTPYIYCAGARPLFEIDRHGFLGYLYIVATTSIYALCEPGTRTVRYIGKTANVMRRFSQHLRVSSKQKTHLGNWLRSLDGDIPNILVLREVPEAEGASEEIFYIRMARMLNVSLVNGTDGGEGVTPTPETRAKMSAAQTPEVRAKLSALNTGENHPQFGTKHSKERIAKRVAAMAGREQSAETVAKRVAKLTGKKRSSEQCARISAAKVGKNNPMFGTHPSEETLAKRSAAMTGEKNHWFGKHPSSETLVRMSDAKKGVPWSSAQRAAYEAKKKSL